MTGVLPHSHVVIYHHLVIGVGHIQINDSHCGLIFLKPVYRVKKLLHCRCRTRCTDCKCVQAHLKCTVHCTCKADCANGYITNVLLIYMCMPCPALVPLAPRGAVVARHDVLPHQLSPLLPVVCPDLRTVLYCFVMVFRTFR